MYTFLENQDNRLLGRQGEHVIRLLRAGIIAFAGLAGVCHAAPGEYVSLGRYAGVLTRPDRPAPRIAVVYDNGFGSPAHPMCRELARRGFLTWCALSTQQPEGSGDWTEVALEVKAAIEFLRREPGIRAVVLYGHSGGGAVAAFYQAVAENGVGYCRDTRKLAACSEALGVLPKADAVVFPDAHPGMDVMSLRGLNPSIRIEGRDERIDPLLDPFSPQNGFNPTGPSHYSAEFQQRYFVAQAQEMRELTEKALAIEAARARERLSPAAALIVIPGFGIATHLDELDPSISATMSTARPERLLRNDGSIEVQLIHSVWNGRSPFIHIAQDLAAPARAFLSVRAVRADDSMTHIEWCSANSDTVCNAGHIRVPVLFMAAGASDFIADEERMYDASPSPDKEYLVVEGALHSGAPCTACETHPGQYANSEKNQYDYIARWINRRSTDSKARETTSSR